MREPTGNGLPPEVDTVVLGTDAAEVEPSVPSFPIGRRLGKYVVVGHAGSGGMSVVLRAHDTELDRPVALKLLRVGTLGAAARARLAREAQALARLSHPNVVPVYDLCTLEEHAFLAMEYVEGMTFTVWLRTPRSVAEVLKVVIAAGRGLAAAHAAGLIHRDVKPSNILVGADGRVRMVDFGLARSATSLSRNSVPTPDATGELARQLPTVTRDDQVVGTPAFMAPEQARGGDVDPRTDQFSLGVTLFYALYGELPFAMGDITGAGDETTQQTAARGLGRRASPHGNVPGHVQATLARMLELEPGRRFDSIDEVLTQLERDPRKTQRRALALVALFVLIAVAGLGWLRDRSSEPPCTHGRERVAEAWSRNAAEAVQKAYLGTKLSSARRAAAFVVARLDAYADEWTRAYKDSCEATQVRGDQSSEVMDLRMACLDERLGELRAVARELARSDAAESLGQSDPVAAFTPISACNQAAALRDMDREPTGAPERAALHAVRAMLATAKAQYAVGQSAEALATLETLGARAQASRHAPLRAEVALWSGRSASDLSDHARAMRELARATELGIGARADATAAEAALRLAQEHLFDAGSAAHAARFEEWMGIARGLLRRHPNEHRLHDIAKRLECSSLWELGKLEERAVCLTELLESARREHRDDHWLYTMQGLALVDVARYAEGLTSLREGLRRVAVELGEDHPLVAEDYGLLCTSLSEAGYAEDANAQCKAGLALATKLGADGAEHVPQLQQYLARTLDMLGRPEEGLALAQLASTSSNAYVAANALGQLGKLEVRTGQQAAGLAHLREALAKHVEQLGTEAHPVLFEDHVGLAMASLPNHPAEARSWVERALDMGTKVEVAPVTRIEAHIVLAEVAAATGQFDDARKRALEALRELDAHGEDAPRTRDLRKRAAQAAEARPAVNMGAAPEE